MSEAVAGCTIVAWGDAVGAFRVALLNVVGAVTYNVPYHQVDPGVAAKSTDVGVAISET